MKNFSLLVWMISGIVAMAFVLFHLAAKEWQPAIFFLLALMYADHNFYRVYNELVEENKDKPNG